MIVRNDQVSLDENATNSSNGAPEFEAAKAELRLARAEVDRIIEEIRNGKRS